MSEVCGFAVSSFFVRFFGFCRIFVRFILKFWAVFWFLEPLWHPPWINQSINLSIKVRLFENGEKFDTFAFQPVSNTWAQLKIVQVQWSNSFIYSVFCYHRFTYVCIYLVWLLLQNLKIQDFVFQNKAIFEDQKVIFVGSSDSSNWRMIHATNTLSRFHYFK